MYNKELWQNESFESNQAPYRHFQMAEQYSNRISFLSEELEYAKTAASDCREQKYKDLYLQIAEQISDDIHVLLKKRAVCFEYINCQHDWWETASEQNFAANLM